MTLASDLYDQLLPGKVEQVLLGASRTVVLMHTDSGLRAGMSSTIYQGEYDKLDTPRSIQAGTMRGMDVRDLAQLFEAPNQREVSIGLAAINAALPMPQTDEVVINGDDYLVEHFGGKNVALIGHFPFVEFSRNKFRNLWVLELKPRPGDLPASETPSILPLADVIALTATTLINKTFDHVMSFRKPETPVLMLGPSTPLSPVMFDHGVNILAGTIITQPEKAFQTFQEGGSLHYVRTQGFLRFVNLTRSV